jgi:hypothetical protein
MSNTFEYRKEYKLTKGYSVEFALDASTAPLVALQAEWTPKVPPPKIVKGKFLEAYRNARNDFVSFTGLKVVVIEQGA